MRLKNLPIKLHYFNIYIHQDQNLYPITLAKISSKFLSQICIELHPLCSLELLKKIENS